MVTAIILPKRFKIMKISLNRPVAVLTGWTQLLRVMKLTAVMLFAAFLQVSANGYSQKVTLHLENVSLEKVFKEIKRQSDFYFLYNNNELKKAGKVTVHVKEVSIEEALYESLSSTGFTYRIVDKTIVLNPMASNRVLKNLF